MSVKLRKRKSIILIFKFVHHVLYTSLYYCLLSTLYVYGFFGSKTFGVKLFLRSWSTFAALLFFAFCVVKVPNILRAEQNMPCRKLKVFIHLFLTILAFVYLLCEFLRILEMFHYVGLSSMTQLHISVCTVVYTVVFLLSMLISVFYSLDSVKNIYEMNSKKQDIKTESIVLVRNILDSTSLCLVVIGYIVGDLEKEHVIDLGPEIKSLKLLIFIFCSFLGLLSLSMALYDHYRVKEKVNNVLIEQVMEGIKTSGTNFLNKQPEY